MDLAIGQADNYVNKFPDNPLTNRRAALSIEVPPIGSKVTTYAYPENDVLDFTCNHHIPKIVSNYYEGQFRRYVTIFENPFIRYPHYETSIQLKGGASGGPVFDSRGRVIGVNCRGWDFGPAEYECENLSSIVPVGPLLSLQLDLLQLPLNSWEHSKIPPHRQGSTFTVKELVDFGHIAFDPPINTLEN